jgi:hypothetical protein
LTESTVEIFALLLQKRRRPDSDGDGDDNDDGDNGWVPDTSKAER